MMILKRNHYGPLFIFIHLNWVGHQKATDNFLGWIEVCKCHVILGSMTRYTGYWSGCKQVRDLIIELLMIQLVQIT